MSALPIVVLISGSGTNLQSILNESLYGNLQVNVKAVIANTPEATGLIYAQKENIPTYVINHREFLTREGFEVELTKVISQYQPKLVVLAGFMRILSPYFVEQFEGKLINIHPSLLPKYTGLNTHARVIQAKEKFHGSTIHFVNQELDGGPLIAQVKIPVTEDTIESLTEKVKRQEHKLYPYVLQLFSEDRITYSSTEALVNGEPGPIQMPANLVEEITLE